MTKLHATDHCRGVDVKTVRVKTIDLDEVGTKNPDHHEEAGAMGRWQLVETLTVNPAN